MHSQWCWSHQESLSLSCPEPSWTKGGATIATMATRQKLCSWPHNPQMQSRHFARTFEKTATQGDVTGWNLKEFRKNLGAALIATVSNKFSLRGERSEPGEPFFCLVALAVSQVQMWQNLKRLQPCAQSPRCLRVFVRQWQRYTKDEVNASRIAKMGKRLLELDSEVDGCYWLQVSDLFL